jgi:hypothetical protein
MPMQTMISSKFKKVMLPLSFSISLANDCIFFRPIPAVPIVWTTFLIENYHCFIAGSDDSGIILAVDRTGQLGFESDEFSLRQGKHRIPLLKFLTMLSGTP